MDAQKLRENRAKLKAMATALRTSLYDILEAIADNKPIPRDGETERAYGSPIHIAVRAKEIDNLAGQISLAEQMLEQQVQKAEAKTEMSS